MGGAPLAESQRAPLSTLARAPCRRVPRAPRQLPSRSLARRVQTHIQHVFKDQFPETRKKMMWAHAKRAAKFEYLPPGGAPVPFDSEKHAHRIHNCVDAVAHDPPAPDMRMVLVDGKWRLMKTGTVPPPAD